MLGMGKECKFKDHDQRQSRNSQFFDLLESSKSLKHLNDFLHLRPLLRIRFLTFHRMLDNDVGQHLSITGLRLCLNQLNKNTNILISLTNWHL